MKKIYDSGLAELTSPWVFAKHKSEGSWKPYRHVVHISTAISKAIWDSTRTGKGARIVVSMPPRHGKSELISHWVPVWFLHAFPAKKVILTTYEADFARFWGRRCRNTIQWNQDINLDIADDTKAAAEWETSKGGGMITAGVGGPITGRGGQLLIIDDPVKNWKEAQSETIRQAIIDWFSSTLYTRAEPGGSIIVLMTRWHERDLAGFLLREHSDKWTEIRLPALAEGGDPLGRPEGQALCPERFAEPALLQIKRALGSSMWAGLYQQRPAPEEGSIWKKEWWKYYREIPRLLRIVQSWDTGFKTNIQNAYSCCQTWGEGKTGFYLIDNYRERLEYPDLKRAATLLASRYNPSIILVEDKASGQSLVQDLKRTTRLPIIGVPIKDGDKESRAKLTSPAAEAGLLFLPESKPWLLDYLDEMTHFPNSQFSDQADATSQAIEYLHSRKARVISGARIIYG